MVMAVVMRKAAHGDGLIAEVSQQNHNFVMAGLSGAQP